MFNDFREEREGTAARIQKMLNENIESRDQAVQSFQTYVSKEMSELRNEVEEESQIRGREDDEILEALSRFTAKLQTSLKVLNE